MATYATEKLATMPDKNAPLTSEEITEAADIFFPLFNIVE